METVNWMTGRLVVAVVTTLCEEMIIVAVIVWGLPRLGINVPLGILVAIMAIWGANSVIFYRIGSRALRRRPVSGLGSVVGDKGKVISPLVPDGVIKIRDELWEAKSVSSQIGVGEEVMVVEQEGLKLIVHESAGSLERTG